MPNPTQQELMAAHNTARGNADKAQAKAAKEGTIPDIADPNKKPDQFPEEHPFGGNENNLRVAQRIARDAAKLKETALPAPLTPGESAAKDLEAAAKLAPETSGKSDAELEADEDAKTAAILAAKQLAGAPVGPTDPQPPVPPAAPAWSPKT